VDIPVLEFTLSATALVATGAASWASVRHQAKEARQDVQRLREEMASTLNSVRKATDATKDLALEALRSTKRSHERIDQVAQTTQDLEMSLTRLDERWQMWARTTQRLKMDESI